MYGVQVSSFIQVTMKSEFTKQFRSFVTMRVLVAIASFNMFYIAQVQTHKRYAV